MLTSALESQLLKRHLLFRYLTYTAILRCAIVPSELKASTRHPRGRLCIDPLVRPRKRAIYEPPGCPRLRKVPFTRLEASFKLSQKRDESNYRNIVTQLAKSEDPQYWLRCGKYTKVKATSTRNFVAWTGGYELPELESGVVNRRPKIPPLLSSGQFSYS